ncbi:MAG: substrate-binding domain-containing protein, partial [Puniceicoccales bacterium]
DSVRVDQDLNISIPAQMLFDKGHRRIAVFGHVPGSSLFRLRLEAYRRFVGENGLRNYSEFQELSDSLDVGPVEKAEAIISLWKSLGREAPTALIASDKLALHLIREAKRSSVAIPRDLSLVGIDNVSACEYVDPPLSSMDEPFGEMCQIAVELLMKRSESLQRTSQFVQLAPKLVERQSVRTLSRDAQTVSIG